MKCALGFLAYGALVVALLPGCGEQAVNAVWQRFCEASCARALECFPEEGSTAECLSECLTGIGNEPCDRNQHALDACLAGIAVLSCNALETGPLPYECRFICAGGGLCEEPTCDDGNACTDDACDPATGRCIGTPVADETPCLAGMNGMCVAGRCAGVYPCSEQGLRDAIVAGGGPHTFDCEAPTTIATGAEIVIQNEVILNGENNLEVNGKNSHRVFSVANAPGGSALRPVVELRRLTISGGRAVQGGGIRNEATLTLVDSTVSGNTALGLGGGIHNERTITLTNTTVSNNIAEVEGGGIFNQFERTLTLVRSTVSHNRVDGEEMCVGGGIRNSGGTLMMMNSTVSGNTTAGSFTCEGGGLHNSGTATIINSTLSSNAAIANELSFMEAKGGGIFVDTTGILALINTTVADNEADLGSGIFLLGDAEATLANTLLDGACELDDASMLTSNGYNIESPGNTCGFNGATDQVSVPGPMLGPLQNNGGPTETHALLAGSVAIDAIPANACVDAEGALLTTDQRDEPRPAGAESKCDVGSIEVQKEEP